MRGGPAGDLYIFLSIGAHPFFQRDGADLHCRVPVSMVTAALGGEFEVPTIDGGKTRVKVPEGTQSGRRFRLQGKGMPVLRARQIGDMYVQVVVETPQKLTKRQRELLARIRPAFVERDAARSPSGFFGKVKEFLDGLERRAAPVPRKGPRSGARRWSWAVNVLEQALFGRSAIDAMPLPALQYIRRGIERQLRLLEVKKTIIERKIERQIRVFEEKRDGIGKKIEEQIRHSSASAASGSTTRCASSVPGSSGRCRIGAVTPSGKMLGAHHGALCRSATATDRWSSSGPAPGR